MRECWRRTIAYLQKDVNDLIQDRRDLQTQILALCGYLDVILEEVPPQRSTFVVKKRLGGAK